MHVYRLIGCVQSVFDSNARDALLFPLCCAVQMRGDQSRVACKALYFCMRLCADAPQLRPALASAAELQAGLAHCLRFEDPLVQGAALALAADLTDSQDAIQALEDNSALREAYAGAKSKFNARAAEGGDAADELNAIEAIDARIAWRDDTDAPTAI